MTLRGLFIKDAELTEAGDMVARVRTTVYKKKKAAKKRGKGA